MDDPTPPPPPGEKPIERVHPALERVLVVLVVASATLAISGSIIVTFGGADFAQVGHIAEAVGLLGAAGFLAAAIPVTTLRSLQADTTGGRRYDLLRGQHAMRVAALLLQLLQYFAVIVILGRIAIAAGWVDLQLTNATMDNGVRVVMGALALAACAALWESLRRPSDRPRKGGASVVAAAGSALVAGLAMGAIAVALRGQDRLGGADATLLVLIGFVIVGAALTRARSLPTLASLAQERMSDRARGADPTRQNAVLLPAVTAFALLLVVFLLFVLFGVGAAQVLSTANNPILLGVLAFLVLAIAGSFGLAFTLARAPEQKKPLYLELPDFAKRRIRNVLLVSGIAGGIFFVLATMSLLEVLPQESGLHFLCLGMLSALGPYGFYAAWDHRRVRRLEERFPDYLRDLAASHQGGLTLSQAATIAAKGEYGDLTPEIRKVADQLSWNVSFEEALARFAERVHTPLVQRAVNLILQADRSGGSTIEVLLAAARDAREIKTLETERRLSMSLYTVVVYVTFFVFLGVVAILYAQFAPQIIASGKEVEALQGDIADGGPVDGFNFGSSGLTLADYRLFYFLSAVVQGIGDGIVAGLLGNGKWQLGLRHAFVMVLLSYLTFIVIL